MSYWNESEIVRWEPTPYEGYPGWTRVDCGCCGGIKWGGESPDECRDCWGGGTLARHDASGALAVYPGGPFVGRDPPPLTEEKMIEKKQIEAMGWKRGADGWWRHPDTTSRFHDRMLGDGALRFAYEALHGTRDSALLAALDSPE